MIRKATFALLLVVGTSTNAATPVTLTDLVGTWKAKTQSTVITATLTIKQKPTTVLCQITATDATNGQMVCGDNVVNLTLNGKRITLTPLTASPTNGFRTSLGAAWAAIFEASGVVTTIDAPSAVKISAISGIGSDALVVSSKKKLANGSVLISGYAAGNVCMRSPRDGSLCLDEQFTSQHISLPIKYISLTR